MTIALSTGPDAATRPPLTVADVWAMVEAGDIGETDHVELIDGELVRRMAPESSRHVVVRSDLTTLLTLKLGRGALRVTSEGTLYLSDNTFVEPDVCVMPRTADPTRVAPQDIQLLIEIAVSSHAYDLERKARLYARHGVREYWVIDAVARQTHVHREPEGDSYRVINVLGEAEALSPTLLPGVTLRLTDLD